MKFSDMARNSRSSAAPSEPSPPHGGVAGQKPDWIPEGMAHTEYALREAIVCFARGTADSRKLAIINLAHAWYIAAHPELGDLEAQRLFREVTDAAGVWQ